jgi:hypothetical protein
MQIQAEFRSIGWSAIALELRADVSLADYSGIRADVLAPADTTFHLGVRFVILAGPSWQWLETKEPIPLEPGKWSVVAAPLEADAWRGPEYSDAVDERQWVAQLREVHKIIVRVESYPDRAGDDTSDVAAISIDNIWFPERDGL